MFGLSFTHLILLAVIALVVLGPEQLPEVARTIARLLNEWKRATSDIQSSLTNTLREDIMKPNPSTPPPPSLGEELPPHEPDTIHLEDSNHHHDDEHAHHDAIDEHQDPDKKS